MTLQRRDKGHLCLLPIISMHSLLRRRADVRLEMQGNRRRLGTQTSSSILRLFIENQVKPAAMHEEDGARLSFRGA